jgi:hypothetical protein
MDRAAVRKLDTGGKVVISTIVSSILPALSVPEERTDWGFLLPKYTTAARQLDALWRDMDPILSLSLPVPRKPMPSNTFSIPDVLNAVVQPEDDEAQPAADATWLNSKEELAVLEEHNEAMDEILQQFDQKIVDSKQKIESIVGSRKRRIEELSASTSGR